MRQSLLLRCGMLLGLCVLGRADLLYTVAFDQVSFGSFIYPADSFSFTTPSLIPAGAAGIVGQIIPVPDGEINGFTFTQVVNTAQTSTASLFISKPFALSGVEGNIDEIFFTIAGSMNGPGTYLLPSPGNGYCIDSGPPLADCLGVSVPSGSLTIAEAVPEPVYFPAIVGTALIGGIATKSIFFRQQGSGF